MNLHAAAQRLGVHYQTAYRWVRSGRLSASKHGAAYEVTDAEVARLLAARDAPIPPPRVTHVRSWNAQVARLHGALTAGDELGARLVVDRLREARIDPVTTMERLLVPALQRIGEDWAAHRISVAAEHRAAAICDRLLARVAVHPRGRPHGVAVVATPPGEEHGLPATMAAVALRADRWQVHHLGTQVPVADLVQLAACVRANVVVLSVTHPDAKARGEEAAEAVRAAGMRVLVGEPGASVRDLLRRASSRRA